MALARSGLRPRAPCARSENSGRQHRRCRSRWPRSGSAFCRAPRPSLRRPRPLGPRGRHTALQRSDLTSRFGEATLWVLEGNARARSWYKRMGWRLIPKRKTTFAPAGIDDVRSRWCSSPCWRSITGWATRSPEISGNIPALGGAERATGTCRAAVTMALPEVVRFGEHRSTAGSTTDSRLRGSSRSCACSTTSGKLARA